ncbi:hypothetical protein L6164_031188 [Bauhinia variegata]|uniref:Uncharacterized protein n=1 Tax=Bauhinia variegata TaxID=167791 RepID=A0ACB9LFJ5_BAUVA|nr:hypothetical protein L6164_031188 [Bauhinia variegata]
MERKRSNRASLLMWALLAGLLSQNLIIPVMSTTIDDQKNYYSPDPHSGTPSTGLSNSLCSHKSPPSHGSGGGYGGTPPSHGGGSYTPTPSTPSGGNCGSPPHDPTPTPSTPVTPTPSTPDTPTPSTPSNPPSGGGGYYNSPPPTYGGSPPTPISLSPPSSPIDPGTPTIPTPPYLPSPTPTPSTPSGGNCGSPPHDPTPSPATPVTPTPSTPDTPTPSTPSNPPSGGGGYYNSPPPTYGGSPPTPISLSPPSSPIDPGTPTIPTPPYLPSPTPFTGTCNYWSTHPGLIWGLLGWWGTMGSAFGGTSFPGFGAGLSFPQALSNTRNDGFGALYREGTASFLNSLVNNRFPYTTKQVRDRFVTSLSSNKAAAAQAHLFKMANEGRIKPRA